MSLEVDIEKNFGEFVLKVNFQIQEKSRVGILGASGCGKSMTLKCIAGIEKPDKGKIVCNGQIFFDSEKKINLPAQKRNVGYLFQNYALFPTMTVENNLRIVCKENKITDIEEKIQQQMERFQLKGLEKRYPSQLSGGQQQRVALARMLLCNPQIIMLDEPFSALDGHLRDIVRIEMLEMMENYSGDVIMVSHARDEIYQFCQDMVLLENGKKIFSGNTKEIFQNPVKMEAAKLTGCKNISAIEKISDYEVYAIDWKIKLQTEKKVGDNIRYIGIRGHYIEAYHYEMENCICPELCGYTETPFEKQYLIKPKGEEQATRIWWMVNKENIVSNITENMPLFLHFPKEKLMLLE